MNALTRLIAWLLTMFYAWILKPLYKSLVDWATGKTELERLVDRASSSSSVSSSSESTENGVKNTCRSLLDLEDMIKDSADPKCLEILTCRDLGRVSEFSQLLVASFPLSTSPSKSDEISSCLRSSLLPLLISYNDVVGRVELLRQTAFDAADELHEAELTRLWRDLQPDRKLSGRVSADWGEIGFQGDDPKTDFRGMGLLGLRNLTFFAGDASFQQSARRTLLRSHHPQFWYSWAIVGINLTSLCLDFLKKGLLKESLYAAALGRAASSSSSSSSSSSPSTCDAGDFHTVFCRVFIAFDEFWIRREKSVMEFNSVREEFRLSFLRQLRAGSLAGEALEIVGRE